MGKSYQEYQRTLLEEMMKIKIMEMSNENVYSRVEDYDTNEDGADEPTFHQSEVESVNIPLKLGDRPRQQVEMSLYSSAGKLDLKLCLLLLPAIFFFRR